MTETRLPDPPSPFVETWTAAVAADLPAPRRALDVAMGRGRHAATLADRGFRVFGVDRHFEAVQEAVASGIRKGYRVHAWCADLRVIALPTQAFDLVVVTRYLQRGLFPSLINAVVPGGYIIYETFTEAQRLLGRGPTSPDHLLRPGELVTYFSGLTVVAFDEVSEPDSMARLVACNRRSRS